MSSLTRLKLIFFCTLIAASLQFMSQASANNIITLSGDLSGTIVYDTANGVTSTAIDISEIFIVNNGLRNIVNINFTNFFSHEDHATEASTVFNSSPFGDADATLAFIIEDSIFDQAVNAPGAPLLHGFTTTLDEGFGVPSSLDTLVTLTFTGNVSSVPEPSTYAMMALGLLGVAGMSRRKNQA